MLLALDPAGQSELSFRVVKPRDRRLETARKSERLMCASNCTQLLIWTIKHRRRHFVTLSQLLVAALNTIKNNYLLYFYTAKLDRDYLSINYKNPSDSCYEKKLNKYRYNKVIIKLNPKYALFVSRKVIFLVFLNLVNQKRYYYLNIIVLVSILKLN